MCIKIKIVKIVEDNVSCKQIIRLNRRYSLVLY